MTVENGRNLTAHLINIWSNYKRISFAADHLDHKIYICITSLIQFLAFVNRQKNGTSMSLFLSLYDRELSDV